ncbi:hypothetical protein CMI37_07315 [Candidatus Pacearchaeota archaeon]|nr:hypothetical protein [Candidatus Pacearchaeota archaeon]
MADLQRSNQVFPSITEIWTTDQAFIGYSMVDSLGIRSRIVRASIRSSRNQRHFLYFPMQRIRILDDYGVITFLGRITQIDPNPEHQVLNILCTDYTGDLSDRSVTAAYGGGSFSGIQRSQIVDEILNRETYQAAYDTVSVSGVSTRVYRNLNRPIPRRLLTDHSNYGEKITRSYASKDDWLARTGGDASSADGAVQYRYRGAKTALEAINEIAENDTQQDLMVIGFLMDISGNTGTFSGALNPDTSDPVTNQTRFWKDFTAEAQDGTSYFIPVNQSNDSLSANQDSFLYMGSNSKFDGVEFSFLQAGDTIYTGDYGTNESGYSYWEYWNGFTWVHFDLDQDSEWTTPFPDNNYGRSYWSIDALADWTKRDLGATPDLATWDSSTGRDKSVRISGTSADIYGDDLQSDSNLRGIEHSQTHIGGLSDVTYGNTHNLTTSTYRYWVRWSTTAIASGGDARIATLRLHSKKESAATSAGVKTYHKDFRFEDPQFLDEIWRYTHTNHAVAGGTWTSLNMTGGNDGSGRRLLWDSQNITTTKFLNEASVSGAPEAFYFGNDRPFNGLSFEAVQGNIVQIESIATSPGSLGTILVQTRAAHGLTNGDFIDIEGTDCFPVLDGDHAAVTVVDSTSFTIAVGATFYANGTVTSQTVPDVTQTGESGVIITGRPDYTSSTINIHFGTYGGTFAGISAAHTADVWTWSSWKRDRGIRDLTPHWYNHIEWDTSVNGGTTAYAEKEFWGSPVTMASQNYRDTRFSLMAEGVVPKSTGNISAIADHTATTPDETLVTTSATHGLKVGDTVTIRITNSTPQVRKGVFTITAVPSTSSFRIADLSITNTGTGTYTAYSYPPNGKSLYWVKIYKSGSASPEAATLNSVRTYNTANFKYFDRGKEPWAYNTNTDSDGSVAVHDLDFAYRWDQSANAGGGFGADVAYSRLGSSWTSGTTITLTAGAGYNNFPTSGGAELISPVAADKGRNVIKYTGKAGATLTGAVDNYEDTSANSSISAPDGSNTNSPPYITTSIDGRTPTTRAVSSELTYEILHIQADSTTTPLISIALPVNSGYREGKYPIGGFKLRTGDTVTLTNTDCTPNLDDNSGVYTIHDVGEDYDRQIAFFNVTHSAAVTANGAGGTVTTPKTLLFTGDAQVNDAFYFGAVEPFSQLRLKVETALAMGSGEDITIVWEYLRRDGSNNNSASNAWQALSQIHDGTDHFSRTGTYEIHWMMPTNWQPSQPGLLSMGTTAGSDTAVGAGFWSAGKSGFYVRARVSSVTGTVSGAEISRAWYGPNIWSTGREVGSLDTVDSTRHADPYQYGLNLVGGITNTGQALNILDYSLGEKPREFINQVVVRGTAGAYGFAQNKGLIEDYRTVREKVVVDSTITNSIQAEIKANQILNTLSPSGTAADNTASTVRECAVTVQGWPIYSYLNKPKAARAGDFVNLILPQQHIYDEKWLIYSIDFDIDSGHANMALFRDLDKISEAGDAASRLMRDLSIRTRETGRAVFTTQDNVVQSGLDFMPNGPSGIVSRLEYEQLGTWDTVTYGGSTKSNTDDYRLNFKLYEDHKTRKDDRVQLRIDHPNVRPDVTSTSAFTNDGAGITFMGRTQYSGGSISQPQHSDIGAPGSDAATPNFNQDSYRDHFYPETGESTLYLRRSARNANGLPSGNQGDGLYLANRGIWNVGEIFGQEHQSTARDGTIFPVQLHHEVFVGISGISLTTADRTVNDVFPDLFAKPFVFCQVVEDGHSSHQGNYANVRSWESDPVTLPDSSSGTVYTGFKIAVYNADGSDNTQADCRVMWIAIFNSARDQRFDIDHS